MQVNQKTRRSVESRAKTSRSLMGHSVSQETRLKMRMAKLGRRSNAWKHGMSSDAAYLNKRNLARIARKAGAKGSHTMAEWIKLKELYDNTCPACKQAEPTIKLTEDHVVPLSRGGSDYIENIQPLCGSCNSRKGTQVIQYVF